MPKPDCEEAHPPPVVPRGLHDLVARFEDQLDAYRSGQYNETQLRREFLDPLFKVLGWDVENEQGYAEAYKDVIHEDAFRHEREVRVFHRLAEMVPGNGGIDIDVDPAILLKEIVLGPFNEPWVNSSLFRAIHLVLSVRALTIPVRTSPHMKPPKRASVIVGTLRFDRLRDSLRGCRRRAPRKLLIAPRSRE